MYLCEYSGGLFNGGSAQLERPNAFIIQQGRAAEAVLVNKGIQPNETHDDCRATYIPPD